MTSKSTRINIFVSSPNDVANERIIVDKVISDLNNTWEECLGMSFNAIRWEDHFVPKLKEILVKK